MDIGSDNMDEMKNQEALIARLNGNSQYLQSNDMKVTELRICSWWGTVFLGGYSSRGRKLCDRQG